MSSEPTVRRLELVRLTASPAASVFAVAKSTGKAIGMVHAYFLPVADDHFLIEHLIELGLESSVP